MRNRRVKAYARPPSTEATVLENLIGGARIRRRIEAVIACGMPVAVKPDLCGGGVSGSTEQYNLYVLLVRYYCIV